MSKYREQYARMKRWYQRFVEIDGGRLHDVESDNYLDEIHAFFMNCYHLKDWIMHDAAVPIPVQQAVEGHINGDRSLKLCADICNSLKHLSLTRPRSHESPTFGKKVYSVGLTVGEPTTISLKWEVDTTNGTENAFKLATECVSAWETFLVAQGL